MLNEVSENVLNHSKSVLPKVVCRGPLTYTKSSTLALTK